MGLGNLYYNINRWRLAEKYYLCALSVYPEHQKICEYMAWIYAFHWELHEKGAFYANKVLDKNPDNFRARLLLACCMNSPH